MNIDPVFAIFIMSILGLVWYLIATNKNTK